MEKKQTAVEWLIDQYILGNYGTEIGEQAKEMEILEIKEAYLSGALSIIDHLKTKKEIITAEEYYEQTYGTTEP